MTMNISTTEGENRRQSEADELEFKPGPVPPLRPVDRYGFVKSSPTSPASAPTKGRSQSEREREERRLRKWRKMIGVGGTDWKHYVRRKPQVVKRRVRKGIPDCLRGLVWQLISGSRDLLLMNQGVYEQLVLYETSAAELDKPWTYFRFSAGPFEYREFLYLSMRQLNRSIWESVVVWD